MLGNGGNELKRLKSGTSVTRGRFNNVDATTERTERERRGELKKVDRMGIKIVIDLPGRVYGERGIRRVEGRRKTKEEGRERGRVS